MFNIRLIASRQDFTHDFFWDSEDPVIKGAVGNLNKLAIDNGDLFFSRNMYSINNDLSLIVEWSFYTDADWDSFKAAIDSSMPNFFTIRDQYFVTAQHGLYCKILDDEGETIRGWRIV